MNDMKALRRKGLRLILGATVATMVVSVAVPANAAGTTQTPPVAALMDNVLVGSGSDTTYDMMKSLDKIYSAANGCATIWASSGSQPKDGTCDGTASAAGNDTTSFPWVNATHDTISEQYPVGSGNGIKELCNQGLANVRNVDFARSSSGKASSAASATCKDLMYIAYAKDAVSWWHQTDGTSADIVDLSTAVLKAIYTGTAQTLNCVGATTSNTTWGDTDTGATCASGTVSTVINQWSDLNGLSEVKDGSGNNFPVSGAGSLPTNSIYVYFAQPGSGTVDYWLKQLGGGSSAITLGTGARFIDTVQENNPNFVEDSAHAADGIYFMSYGRFRQNAGTTAVYDGSAAEYTDSTHATALGKIAGIAPTHTTILAGSGTFPNARNVYNVLRYPSAKILNYLGPTGMLCSTSMDTTVDRVTGKYYRAMIEDAIKGDGFVPLTSGSTGGTIFDGKYGLGSFSSTNSYCRVSDQTSDYMDTVAPTVGIDEATIDGATFAFNEPVTSVDTTKIGARVKGADGTWGTTYLDDTVVSFVCKNLQLHEVSCDGTDSVNPNRYGADLISKVVVTPLASLAGSSITYGADAAAGSDRAGNASAAFNADNANLNVNFTFNAQTSSISTSKLAPGRSRTFAKYTNGNVLISVSNRSRAFCTVKSISSTSYKVIGLRRGTCRLTLTAAGTTDAGTGTIYNAYSRSVSISIKR